MFTLRTWQKQLQRCFSFSLLYDWCVREDLRFVNFTTFCSIFFFLNYFFTHDIYPLTHPTTHTHDLHPLPTPHDPYPLPTSFSYTQYLLITQNLVHRRFDPLGQHRGPVRLVRVTVRTEDSSLCSLYRLPYLFFGDLICLNSKPRPRSKINCGTFLNLKILGSFFQRNEMWKTKL